MTCSIYVYIILISTNVVFISCQCNDGYYLILSGQDKKYALDGEDASVTQIRNTDENSLNQLWKFECGSHVGLYKITNLGTNFLLEAGAYPPHSVSTTPENGLPYQEWFVNSKNRLVNAGLMFILEVEGGGLADGTPLTTAQDTHSTADPPESRQFILERILLRKNHPIN